MLNTTQRGAYSSSINCTPHHTHPNKHTMVAPSDPSAAAAAAAARNKMPNRGAFVLLEGVDRCGKTTQCRLLYQRLLAAGVAATAYRFPDRTTATGRIINEYLQSDSAAAVNLNDRAIHLLFSANRWESVGQLSADLAAGKTVVCDRYAYSGVAFSAAKVDPVSGEAVVPLDWCQAPDRGLPAPDCVIFLDLSQEEAEQRGGYV
jgi:dTMP kinase